MEFTIEENGSLMFYVGKWVINKFVSPISSAGSAKIAEWNQVSVQIGNNI